MSKYLTKSMATVQGHFIQARKKSISTQVPISMEPRNEETNLVFTTVVDTGKVYSHQRDHSTVKPIRGVKYEFILYS